MPHMSPNPDSPKPEGTAHYQAEDDIELPPILEGQSEGSNRADNRTSSALTASSKRFKKAIGAAFVMGAVAIGGFFFASQGGSLEKQHENWQHVAAAAKASTDDAQQLIHLDASGASAQSASLEVSSADMNRAAMQQIRIALMRNDLVSASAALQAAQNLPSPSANPDVRLPTIDTEMATAIKEGRKELYQIELFDCCHEDGDIVEVLVNGKSFAAVPIMHQGTMVSIPLDRGSNVITVRGVKDGGGGVTVSFRTSRGEYFARYMSVGEEHSMDVIVQ